MTGQKMAKRITYNKRSGEREGKRGKAGSKIENDERDICGGRNARESR
jgi:hypothetical protein